MKGLFWVGGLLAPAFLAGCASEVREACSVVWSVPSFFSEASAPEITRCLNLGFDPNEQTGGMAPLHLAVTSTEHPAVIEALLNAGADLNARDVNGLTPLYYAVLLNKNLAVTEALLNAGADLNARDEDGETPLHIAARYSENPAVIEALLNAGADLNTRDEDGATPWDLAKDREELKGSEAYGRLNDGRVQ